MCARVHAVHRQSEYRPESHEAAAVSEAYHIAHAKASNPAVKGVSCGFFFCVCVCMCMCVYLCVCVVRVYVYLCVLSHIVCSQLLAQW